MHGFFLQYFSLFNDIFSVSFISEKLLVTFTIFSVLMRGCALPTSYHSIGQNSTRFLSVQRNGNEKSKVDWRKFVSSLERTLELMVREGKGRRHNGLAGCNSVYLSSSQDKQIKPSSLLQSLQPNQRGNLLCHSSLVFPSSHPTQSRT